MFLFLLLTSLNVYAVPYYSEFVARDRLYILEGDIDPEYVTKVMVLEREYRISIEQRGIPSLAIEDDLQKLGIRVNTFRQ